MYHVERISNGSVFFMQKEMFFLKELDIKLSSNQRAFTDLLGECAFSPEDWEEELRQLQQMDPLAWEELQKEEIEAQEKLQRALAQVTDPQQTAAKRRVWREVQPHWVFVK